MSQTKENLILIDRNVSIRDLTKQDDAKWLYILIADVTGTGDLAKDEQVVLKFDPALDDRSYQEIVGEHVRNILCIQSVQGGSLSNIRLINLTTDEAVERGYLREPGIINHV